MTILSISRDWGTTPSVVRVTDNANLNTITATGYVFEQSPVIETIQKGEFEWAPTDQVLISYSNGQGYFTYNPLTGTFIAQEDPFGTVTAEEVQRAAFNTSAATGADDAFIVTLSPAPTALTDGLTITMDSGAFQNLTASPTLKVNALPVKPIVTFAGSLAPGDIQQNNEYIFVYSLTNDHFQLINPSTTTADTFQVQSSGYSYALDTGVANAYIANILPAQLTTQSGLQVVMTAVNANTGASTLTVNGATHPILLSNGDALSGGEILVDGIYQFFYSSDLTAFVLMNASNQVSRVSPGLQNELAYYAADGTEIDGLPTANRGFLITSIAGEPSISNTITAIEDQSTNTTFGTPTLLMQNSTGINYPVSASFRVTLGSYLNLLANTSQTINSSTPGGFNFVYGSRQALVYNNSETNDLSRLHLTGFENTVSWNSTNTAQQLLGFLNNVTYRGSNQDGRTTPFLMVNSNTLTIQPPSDSVTTITNATCVSQTLRHLFPTNTGCILNITDAQANNSSLNFPSPAASNTTTITNASTYASSMTLSAAGAGSTLTITNLYGIRLESPSVGANTTITNRFGVSSEDASAINYFAGVVNGALSIQSGLSTGGTAGSFLAYSPTAAMGSTSLTAADNAGNFANVLTNASTAAARTWTLPDATGTIALTSGSAAMTYNSVAGTSQAATGGNAYILNNAGATTVTLPTSGSSTIGDTIKIKGRSAAPYIVQANTGQIITMGTASSTVAGTATSSDGTDTVQLVYVAVNEWSADYQYSTGFVLA